ncbi:MAG TPA: hypothetical protein VH914_02980 [Acidimicrobiia bacterium]|jgi:hypothetical protein|nr:hypothetical protein [Acidimicrobiia bacterium]
MTRRQSNLLIAAAVWTIYVWISFVVIQTRQNTSVGFKVVHGVLALISICFGIAIGVMGWRARRSAAGAPAVDAPSAPAEAVGSRRV